MGPCNHALTGSELDMKMSSREQVDLKVEGFSDAVIDQIEEVDGQSL